MTIAFKKVKDAYGWMSNMSPHPVGQFRTAEALFQACRFDDPQIIKMIHEAKSPMSAKMIAKANAREMAIVPRSPRDVEIMETVVLAKLNCHPDLKQQLLATGDQLIIEDVTSRPNESGLFWGAAQVSDETAADMERLGIRIVREDGKNWHGENVLGKIWMKIRKELQSEAK